MTRVVRVTLIIVRITGGYPMAVSMRRVTVIATNPDILSVLPFVMAGDPDR
jgi:hypothetical protein